MNEAQFKTYCQNQPFLLPPNIEEMIPEGHVVKVMNKIIDKMNISEIINTYKGGGTTAYHPVMMLKVVIYGYMEGVYTSRKIGKALKENIYFMWLSGMQRPNFRTINEFRSNRLKRTIKEIFKEVVKVAMELGLVDLEKMFVDGTKIEANANRYKIVWRKNVARYKAGVEEKLEKIVEDIERINEEENKKYGDRDLPEINEDVSNRRKEEVESKINESVEKINKALSKKRKKLGGDKEKLEKRRDKYIDQEKIMDERNSYAKTDEDASGMRMKNSNEEIRPGYNVMTGTENQIIVNYEIEQNAGDSGCFTNLMNGVKSLYGENPKNVVGDQAFGTEENYNYSEREGIKSYLKFNTFHYESTKKFKENIFLKEHFKYETEKDKYICPAGKEMRLIEERERKNKNGYISQIKVYESKYDCTKCKLKTKCTESKRRTIQINEELERYKTCARELLNSEAGIQLRKERGVDVETPYGNIKQNYRFRRFMLRGKNKVTIEMGLLSIGHNLRKIAAKIIEETGKNMLTDENLQTLVA